MIKKIDECTDLIDNICYFIIAADYEKFSEEVKQFMALFLELLPLIVSSYLNPQMAEYTGDASYWPAQYERITKAINGKDVFNIIDILNYETKKNLIEFKDIIVSKGIC